MTDELEPEVLGDFFDYTWGPDRLRDQPTFVYLPVHKAPLGPKDWQPFFFEWPRQRGAVIRHCLRWSAEGSNVYHSPALYHTARPGKENVLGSWLLWVDFDGNAPTSWTKELNVPPPTLRIQTSVPSHEHVYWALTDFLTDISILEDRNRALAYTLKADASGWDGNQILRPPGTVNHRYGKKEGPEGDFPVLVKEWLL